MSIFQKIPRLSLVTTLFSIFSMTMIMVFLTFSLSLPASAADAGYHLLKRITIGGEGGWDYLTVDSSARRVYISRGTHVLVLDADSYKVVGDIPDTPGVHGIALASEFRKGFISNVRENTVSMFDLKTLKTLQKIKVGQNPDAILYDPATRRVFTFNGKSQDSTAIDAATGSVLGTIALGGKPEFAVSDRQGQIFVNIEDKSLMAVLDPRSLQVKSKWDLKPCQEPSGLALDRAHNRLFAGCDNKLMTVVDGAKGNVIANLPIGEGVDATSFDPDTQLAFSSNGEGTLTVVHEDSPDKFRVVENVKTEEGARTMALDEKTHNVFLVTARRGPPPAPTAENPHPRPSVVPGTFVVLVFGR